MDFENDTSWVRGILHPDETLIWTGRPRKVFLFQKEDLVALPVGVAMIIFGIYFIQALLRSADSGPGTTYGIVFMCVFLLVALWMTVGRPLLSYRNRKKARYALTSRRLIVDDGKERKSLDLTNLPNMTVTQRSDGSGNIAIGERTVTYRRKSSYRSYQVPELLLENLENVNQVEYRIRSAVDQALAARNLS